MAEDLARIVAENDGPEGDPPASYDPAESHGATPPYQARFQLLFGVLLGVALAAVVATVLFVGSGRKGGDPAAVTWAAWHPTTSNGLQAVTQIADHVGQRYTLPSGNQLVGVRGGPLELARLPVTIALQNAGKVQIFDQQGVMYNFCGLGKNCSIKEGKPSVKRHLVLQRESLELALYTFRYIKNIGQVIVIMPPPPGKKASEAMFYRRGDVGASLDRPLDATLPGTPPAVNRLTQAQGDFILRLTQGNLFNFTPQEGGDAHIYLVLSPLTG
jgi:hypothetical protein